MNINFGKRDDLPFMTQELIAILKELGVHSLHETEDGYSVWFSNHNGEVTEILTVHCEDD